MFKKSRILTLIILLTFISCNQKKDSFIYNKKITFNIPFEFVETDDKFFDTYNKDSFVIVMNPNNKL
jgi:hypothetical protein